MTDDSHILPARLQELAKSNVLFTDEEMNHICDCPSCCQQLGSHVSKELRDVDTASKRPPSRPA